MSKFLYVTDQDEYTDHSFIGPLFQKYLNRHFEINTIFFSKFKTDIELKDDGRIIIPENLSSNLLEELDRKGIAIKDFAFVVVRNNTTLLKDVLKKRIKYNYKVGFRLSFPKRIAKLQTDEANNKKSFFDIINNKIQTFSEISLINECDIFLPTSFQMKNDYFKDVKTRTFVIPSAIDPDVLHDNIQHDGAEKRFFYAGNGRESGVSKTGIRRYFCRRNFQQYTGFLYLAQPGNGCSVCEPAFFKYVSSVDLY